MAQKSKQLQQLLLILKEQYRRAFCALIHRNPLELLIATILSAQCTDERVNLVTRDLFRKYRTAGNFAQAPREELESLIHSTGFFRNKAQHIQLACRKIQSDFHQEVPNTMEELLTLPGVARKTANVVLGTAFGIASGIVVDTHVFRLAHRMGLSQGKTPEKVEQDLMRIIPPEEWIDFSHRLIQHGRQVCSARKPDCAGCALERVCPRIGTEKTNKPPAS